MFQTTEVLEERQRRLHWVFRLGQPFWLKRKVGDVTQGWRSWEVPLERVKIELRSLCSYKSARRGGWKPYPSLQREALNAFSETCVMA